MNIAIAVDLSVESHFAVRWALDLRARAREHDRTVKCYAVVITSSPAPYRYHNLGFPEATDIPDIRHRLVHQVRNFLETVNQDVDDVEVVVEEGEPAESIAAFCSRKKIDWLITGMSSVGPFARLFLGSTVHDLIDLVPTKLVIVHPEHCRLEPPLDFAIGVDFLPGSEAALFTAADLTDVSGAHLHLVHALQDAPTGTVHGGLVSYLAPTDVAHLTADARNSLEAMMSELERQHPGINYSILVHSGAPKKVILDFIERQNIDAVFLGRILRSTFEKWTLGSVARSLVKRMPTTMLLVPPEA